MQAGVVSDVPVEPPERSQAETGGIARPIRSDRVFTLIFGPGAASWVLVVASVGEGMWFGGGAAAGGASAGGASVAVLVDLDIAVGEGV